MSTFCPECGAIPAKTEGWQEFLQEEDKQLWCRARSQQRRKKPRKRRTADKNKQGNRFSPTSETPQKTFRRCLARSSKLGHTQNTKNKRAATTNNLNIACSKPPSKVRAIGARRLVRVKKQKNPKRGKQNKTRDTKPKTKKARPPTTGKRRYDKQVCYDPMHPTYPPLHMRR